MMKDFRMWLGKHGTSHTGTLLERCALTLVRRKQDRAIGRRAYTGGAESLSEDKDEIEINAIFCEAFVFAMDSNFFGTGPPRHCNRRGPCKKRDVQQSEEFTTGEDGFSTVANSMILLNKDSLKILSTGEDRSH